MRRGRRNLGSFVNKKRRRQDGGGWVCPSCSGNPVLLEPSGLQLVLLQGCSREDAGADAFHARFTRPSAAPAAPSCPGTDHAGQS